ncbi:MAG: hypothetical protein WBE72_09375 [Terracidiphilus sp.]
MSRKKQEPKQEQELEPVQEQVRGQEQVQEPEQQQQTSKASENASEKADAGVAAAEDGMESFRSAAEMQLSIHGDKIAKLIGDKAALGDLNCAKLLVGVAKDKARKNTKKKKRGPSMAQRIAAEPPWEEPVPDPDAEISGWNGDPDA